jgi:lipopolysaccharide transport system permease protein
MTPLRSIAAALRYAMVAVPMSFWRNRELISQMSRRDIIGRYRGSVLGLLWSFVNPILMLAVYTYVFSVAFKARWTAEHEAASQFAIIVFTGMIVHGLLAECVHRAPTVILSHVNYVKKVVFPLESLCWVILCSAAFHTAMSSAVLLLFLLLTQQALHWTVLLLPLVLLPLLLLSVGCSWVLASIGVFVRDVAQVTSLVTSVLLFLSPVFYPVSAIPEQYRPLLYANPLTLVINQSRDVLLWGRPPSWPTWCLELVASLVVASLGLWWFERTRKGFADVL